MARALDPGKSLQQCTVQTWRTRDGMPGVWVRSILQSDEGYLWIATYGGVARYDGERMDPLETPGHMVRLFDTMMLKPEPAGSLLIVPSVGGPVCLDDAGLHDCGLEGTSLPAGARLVDVHRQPDGVSWLAARTALYRHRPGEARLESVPLPWAGEFRLMFVHLDRRGRLWLGSSNGLLVGTPDARGVKLDFLSGPAGPYTAGVNAMFEAPSGSLWFAGGDGLLRVDPDGRMDVMDRARGWPAGRPWQITQDRQGTVWVGHSTGLLRLRDGRLDRFDERDGLPDAEITAVFEDREGGLWVGTRSAGVAQFTDRTVQTGAGPPSLRVPRPVESITETPDGTLWFGTRSGLVRWAGGVERLFTARDDLPSSNVLAVAPATSGGLWVGTASGLARLREGPRGAVTITRALSVDARVEAFLPEPDGSLLLNLNGRLARLPAAAIDGPIDAADRALIYMGVADDLPLGWVRAMGRVGGTLYVAGVTAVGRLDGTTIVDSGLPRELRTARAMHTDQKGRLWITTGAGLVRLGAGAPQLFGGPQGISDRHLFQVQTDGRGHVWVGSSRGVLRLSEQELDDVAAGRRPRVYPQSLDVSDRRRDVVSTNVRQPGSLRDHLGRLWFATEHGPLMIDPARLPLNTRPPAVRIEKAVVDGRPVRRDGANELPPGPGNLEFRFSAVTLLEPHKSLHRYMLEGFDRGWIEAGARRVAYYTNIPAGRYRFRVQGSNADGVWNERGDTLQFRVRPHFYRTGWFYGLLAAVVLAAVTLLWRLRVRSLRREYLAAFTERSRVARELHDTLLQGMSAVGFQLRGLRRRLTSEAPGAARELEQLEGTITSSLQETRRFLSDLREQPGAAADLGVALERLAGRLTAGHAARPLVKVEGTPVPLPHAATGDLFRIASEAVTNAVKHAAPTQIEVGLHYGTGEVSLTVRDDGRGFDPARAPGAAQGHFGLVGMRERGERLGGYLLESQPGQGTTVRATLRLASGPGSPAVPAS